MADKKEEQSCCELYGNPVPSSVKDGVMVHPDTPTGRLVCNNPPKRRATELEYLKWFRQNADFGPADGDVKDMMDHAFMNQTGKLLPKGWNFDSSGNEMD